jgi:hypothetical protein
MSAILFAAPAARIFVNFYTRDFIWVSVNTLQVWLKSKDNIRLFTWRTKYIFIVYSSTKYFAAWQQCRGNLVLRSDGSTRRFRIFRGYMSVNYSAKGLLLSTASVFTWTPPPPPNFYVIRTLPIFFNYLNNVWLGRKMSAPWKFTDADVHSIEWDMGLWDPFIRRCLRMLFYNCGGGVATNKIRSWFERWCGVLRGCDKWDVSRQRTKIAWWYLRQPLRNSGYWATGKDLKACLTYTCLKL